MRDLPVHIASLQTQVESVLDNPSSTTKENYRVLLERVLRVMDHHPQARPLLGPHIGALRKAVRLSEADRFDWVNIAGGRMTVGHRPKQRTISDMPFLGVTHVVTLLSGSEGAAAIGQAVRKAGVGWFWLPLPSADPPSAAHAQEIIDQFEEWQTALEAGGSVYVHCSAGIHRTGMITYAFLRWLGNSPEESRHRLGAMRSETLRGVGEHRLTWGDRIVH